MSASSKTLTAEVEGKLRVILEGLAAFRLIDLVQVDIIICTIRILVGLGLLQIPSPDKQASSP